MKPFVFINNKKKNLVDFSFFDNLTNSSVKIRHIPSISKEWKNNVYLFNFNKTKNLPIFDYLADNLISAYFNSGFQVGKYKIKLLTEGVSKKTQVWFRKHPKKLKLTKINKGFTKIFVSKSEINHVNNIAIVNLYVYNRKEKSFLKKIKTTRLKSKRFLKKFIMFSTFFNATSKDMASVINPRSFTSEGFSKNRHTQEMKLMALRLSVAENLFPGRRILAGLARKKNIYLKFLSILEKLKFKFSLNQYKFEERLLYILASSLMKFYHKKVEFNIINLRSIAFNSDIFTKILSLKARPKRINPHRTMKVIFHKAFIPRTNKIQEKTSIRKKLFWELKEVFRKKLLNNKKILNRNRLFSTNEQSNYSSLIFKCLNNIYTYYTNNKLIHLYKNVFNSIHYKHIGGIRLEIKGRLTWRYRADRSRFKARRKGGFRNIESSHKRLPTVIRRGNEEYNLRYSMFAGKRHVGAFAVKGWISGK